MSRYISDTVKNLVTLRAEYLCEYCFMHEEDAFLSHEIEHIISLKHGGITEPDNLAYACFFCNEVVSKVVEIKIEGKKKIAYP